MARCGRGSGEVSDFPSSAMTCGCGPEVIVRREARVSTRENDPSQAWQRRRRAGTARNRTAFRRGSGASPVLRRGTSCLPSPPGRGWPEGPGEGTPRAKPPERDGSTWRDDDFACPDLLQRPACIGRWKAEGYGGAGDRGGGASMLAALAGAARALALPTDIAGLIYSLRELVGTVRFELTTPSTPCWCATRLRYAPTGRRTRIVTRAAPGWRAGRRVSGAGCTGLPRVRGVPA